MMIKENEYNYFDEEIILSDDFKTIGFIVKPEIRENGTYLLVCGINHNNYNNKEIEYYGYCIFDAFLKKKINLNRENMLSILKEIYLETDKYTNNGCSTSGSKEIIIAELLSDFKNELDVDIINKIFEK